MIGVPVTPDASRSPARNLHETLKGLSIWAVGSGVLVAIYAASWWSEGFLKVVSIFGHGAMIAFAFSGVGSLVGFLFGIPRTLQSTSPAPPQTSSSSAGAANPSEAADAYRQTVNTNLEQISDWLTKILVGVGLTQLQHIPEKLERMASYFQSGLGGNAPITLVILLNAMVFGFFAGYLLTRLFLAGAFYDADTGLIGKEQYARGLTEAGAYTQAISTLEAALAQLGPSTSADVKKNIYASLMYNYLYLSPPGGFQKAIEYGEAYNQQEPDNPGARIWAYLAAAYGQQYKWENERDKRPAVLQSARANALKAIQNALKLDPTIKPMLHTLWDPNDPTKERSQEDDLEVFYDDPDFKKLLA
jgi:tetratricopeptide (TPR) repeat protein